MNYAHAIWDVDQLLRGNTDKIDISGFVEPSYLTVLSSAVRRHNITSDQIFIDSNLEGYLGAMGLPIVLGNGDTYEFERINDGENYCAISEIYDENSVNKATDKITSTMRSKIGRLSETVQFSEMSQVLGEIIDNVSSHSESTGFAVAQYYPSRHKVVVSVCDSGMGFLEQVRASGRSGIESDREAIEWCLVKGNTTKGSSHEDQWAQTIPVGGISSPFGPHVPVSNVKNGNNHQGLGLHHLTNLSRSCCANITIFSGNCLCEIANGVDPKYTNLSVHWKGVIINWSINCQYFDTDENLKIEDDVSDIIDILGGD